jgi:hypothetical protein
MPYAENSSRGIHLAKKENYDWRAAVDGHMKENPEFFRHDRPIPKTDFIEVLEDIHKHSELRYGQIMNNALQVKYGSNKHEGSGTCYDTFYTRDEEFTETLKEYRERCKEDGLYE